MQPIYIEASDEVTTVIERLKSSGDSHLALIVPKGAILLQSIVNLKLIKRAAEEAGVEIHLITTDQIGRNLSTQLGIPTHTKFDPKSQELSADNEEAIEEMNVIGGVKIHRYYDAEEVVEDGSPEPIVPKKMLRGGDDNTSTIEIVPKREPIKIRSIAVEPLVEPDPLVEPEPPIEPKPAAEKLPAEKPVEAAELKRTRLPDLPPEETKKAKKARRWLAYIAYLLILLLVAAGTLAYLFLPKTTVAVSIPAQAWQKDYSVTAATTVTAVDLANKQIPAVILSGKNSASITFKATGTKDVGDKATGTAQLYNRNGKAITLPAGTHLTANGQGFLTNAEITLPLATVNPDGSASDPILPGSNSVNVIAENAGPDGNLTAVLGAVNTDQANLYCRIVSTTGGSSRTVNVVTQADITNAKNSLTSQLTDSSRAKLVEAATSKQYYSNESLDTFTLSDFTSSVQAGTEADSAQVSGSGEIKRLAVDKTQADSFISLAINQEQSANTVLVGTGNNLKQADFNIKDSLANLIITANGSVRPVVKTDNILNQLAGKSELVVQNLIKTLYPQAVVKISHTPTWWPNKKVPSSLRYVHVQVNYNE